MTVVTGQAGGDETPDVVEALVNELCDVRAQLATAQGDLYDRGEDLVKARARIAELESPPARVAIGGIRALIINTLHDRLGYRPENAADPRERFAFPHANEIADALAPVIAARLAEVRAERDRARDVAVALEQEASVYGEISRPFGDDPDGEHDDDEPGIPRNPAGELDRILAEAVAPTDHCLTCGRQFDPDEPTDRVTRPWGLKHPTCPAPPGSGGDHVTRNALSERLVEMGRQELAGRVRHDRREYENTPIDPDAGRPAVAAGQWVRILERPAGLPAGQIGKVLPPGFTPPSTPASRVIAVRTTAGETLDAVAWERGSWGTDG